PGDGDALLLAAAQPQAPLPHHGVVAPGEFHDEVVGLGAPGGGDDLVHGGVGPAVGDVLADAGREQERLLQHEADVAAQALQFQVPHVIAVHQHPAGGDVV